MKNSPTIRPAIEEDLPFLVELWLQLMIHHENDSPLFQVKANAEDGIREILLKKMGDASTEIIIAEDNSNIHGFIICSFQIGSPIFKLYKKGYIAETIIGFKYRRLGIGTLLYEAAETWLKEKKVDHIQLQVSVKNESGIEFWTKRGFDKVTFSMNKEV